MRLAAAFLLPLLAVSPAFAATPAAQGTWNARATENNQVLPNFTYANVESVLASIGARSERRGLSGRPALVVTFANGRRAAIVFTSCDARGATCRAISIQTIWARPANVSAERLQDALQRFNQRHAFSRAILAPDGRPMLQRYLTADYGFIRGNLAVNLLVYAEQAARFAEALRPLG